MARKIKKTLVRIGLFRIPGSLLLFLRRGAPFLAVLLLTAAGIFWVRHALYAAKILTLEKVRLIGLETLKPEEVLKEANIRRGTNLLELDLDGILKGLKKDPRVRTVALKKIFPNRLEIRIEERRPVLQVYAPRGHLYYLIDEDGYLLPNPSQKPPAEFLVFEDRKVAGFPEHPGARYFSKNLEKLLNYFEGLENDPLITEEHVRRVRVDEIGFWTLVTEDGIEFRIGEDFDNLSKLENFKVLLHSEVRQTLDYLDLRFQDVVVKIKREKKN
jgi:cell division protein FtsQ